MKKPSTRAVTKKGAYTIGKANFTGPLPPPALLAEYEKALPGSAERILQMAEQEQAQQHKESSAMVAAFRLGQLMSFMVMVTLVAVSATLILTGREIIGGMLVGTAVLLVLARNLMPFKKRR